MASSSRKGADENATGAAHSCSRGCMASRNASPCISFSHLSGYGKRDSGQMCFVHVCGNNVEIYIDQNKIAYGISCLLHRFLGILIQCHKDLVKIVRWDLSNYHALKAGFNPHLQQGRHEKNQTSQLSLMRILSHEVIGN